MVMLMLKMVVLMFKMVVQWLRWWWRVQDGNADAQDGGADAQDGGADVQDGGADDQDDGADEDKLFLLGWLPLNDRRGEGLHKKERALFMMKIGGRTYGFSQLNLKS